VVPVLSEVRLDDSLQEVRTVRRADRRAAEVVRAAAGVVGIGTTGPAQHLERIVVAACRLVGARYGALGVIGPDQRLVEFITDGLTVTERADIATCPPSHGILAAASRTAAAAAGQPGRPPLSAGFRRNHPPMRSFLGVPIRVREQSSATCT